MIFQSTEYNCGGEAVKISYTGYSQSCMWLLDKPQARPELLL